jgi:hydroxymethylpyrimidine/phosphomethylpyrimidine kinase
MSDGASKDRKYLKTPALTRSGPKPGRMPVALTIAGSDSGGCAGIQADLRAFRNLAVHGASAITCVTAQNTTSVDSVVFLSTHIIRAQIQAVVSDLGCAAAKTGMLGTSTIVSLVARTVKALKISTLVVDPVMVSTAGARLLQEDAVQAMLTRLIPLGTLVTPNLLEAEWLAGRSVRRAADMKDAADIIFSCTGCAVLVKGGHLTGRAVDLLYDGKQVLRFSTPRVATRNTHGSGCTLSAAITACLARGRSLEDAVGEAKEYVFRALQTSYSVGAGPGPLGDA